MRSQQVAEGLLQLLLGHKSSHKLDGFCPSQNVLGSRGKPVCGNVPGSKMTVLNSQEPS